MPQMLNLHWAQNSPQISSKAITLNNVPPFLNAESLIDRLTSEPFNHMLKHSSSNNCTLFQKELRMDYNYDPVSNDWIVDPAATAIDLHFEEPPSRSEAGLNETHPDKPGRWRPHSSSYLLLQQIKHLSKLGCLKE